MWNTLEFCFDCNFALYFTSILANFVSCGLLLRGNMWFGRASIWKWGTNGTAEAASSANWEIQSGVWRESSLQSSLHNHCFKNREPQLFLNYASAFSNNSLTHAHLLPGNKNYFKIQSGSAYILNVKSPRTQKTLPVASVSPFLLDFYFYIYVCLPLPDVTLHVNDLFNVLFSPLLYSEFFRISKSEWSEIFCHFNLAV